MFQRLWSDPEGMPFVIKRTLAEYGMRYWRPYALSLLMGGIASGCTASVAYLIGHVVNEAYVQRSVREIFFLCAVAIGVFALRGLALYWQAVTLTRVTNHIVADSQWRIFEKFLAENVGYFADRHSSEFMARIGYAAGAPAGILNLLINSVGRDLLTLVGLLTVMVMQDPILSLMTLLLAPPTTFFVRRLVDQARALAYAQYQSSAAILETVQETLQGIRVVKVFNLEDKMRRRLRDSIATVQSSANKMSQLANRTGPLMEFLGGVAVAGVLGYGGYRVVATNTPPGQFFSFITAFLLAYEPAKRLARINLDLSVGLVGLQLLYAVLDAPNTEPDDGDKPELSLRKGHLEFTAVDFSYRPDEPVLRKTSFVAAPGRVTALVGPSGGGKTTIFNLILRLYKPNGGTISIDDQDISAVSRRSVRNQIGYVGQDVFLFRGTVRDNIAIGDPNATERQIVDAAKAAMAHEFITSFPKGYDSPVGELGTQLSTGQRQRIAIARALLKDAKLILLDEPTSALDSESERRVAEAIERLCAGRTTLVIAHRLHTIVQAHCIHVVDNGIIVQSGRHDDLLRKNGLYAQLYRLQFRHQMGDADLGASDQPHRLVSI